MKKLVSTLFILATTFSYSQIIENDFTPNVLPPSPTASSLMKFEEIPVSYYTGIPNVSIPIISPKLKNGQNLEVKLDYHPANINGNQEASDCGLGWSLIAGGSISRTVKGYPDELDHTDGTPENVSRQIGIYQDSNNYYEYLDILENETINTNADLANEYLWDVNVKSKFDTEHDLYQYNFMGYTGRFFIKKESGNLVVVKLDKNPLKITNIYNSSTYVHDSFQIVDEYGNKYLFNVKETSTYSSLTSLISYSYITAFHLKEIRDANNILQATFNYSSFNSPEGINLSTVTLNIDKFNVLPGLNTTYEGYNNYNPLPLVQSNLAKITTAAKKLESIAVEGICNIEFGFTPGRNDTLGLLSDAHKLSEISIKTWNGELIKKFAFTQGYTISSLKSRMILNRVDLYDKTDAFVSKYVLSYKQNVSNIPLGKDYWGYSNRKYCETTNLNTAPGLSDIDILEKIQYPEGGCAVFNYESNSYSYDGDVALTDFSENPNSWYIDHSDGSHLYNNDEFDLEFSSSVQYVDLHPGVGSTNDIYQYLYLYKDDQRVGFLACQMNCSDCKMRLTLDANAAYKVKVENYPGGEVDVWVDYLSMTSPAPKSLLGGGNRISKISYYENDSPTSQLIKEINYDYSFFGDATMSSGALAYPKPVYSYEKGKTECPYQGNNINSGAEFEVVYDVVTFLDNLAAIKTKGADVGYKNVTVYETGNGFKKLVYTNSIDHPEVVTIDNISLPFLPTLNIDYKRGLLLEEYIYGQQNSTQALKHTLNTYSFVEDIVTTGINVFNPAGSEFNNVRNYDYYSSYKNYLDTHTSNCFCCFNTPLIFTRSEFHKEVLGWAKLDSTVTTESFYNTGTANWDDVITANTYIYNPINYKVATETVTDAYGQSLKTDYFYACDNAMSSKPNRTELVARNMIGIPLVVQKTRGTTQELFEKETEYALFPSDIPSFSLLLPENIYTKKDAFSNPRQMEITFDYDTKANLIEFKKQHGQPTSFVWGYNKCYPVAKIENCAYGSISNPLIDAVDTASNSPTATRAQVINALNSLRLGISNAMITTQTYDSILGITSITDPKGYTIYYEYDDFGRLKQQSDTHGVISENEYHYRTEN